MVIQTKYWNFKIFLKNKDKEEEKEEEGIMKLLSNIHLIKKKITVFKITEMMWME